MPEETKPDSQTEKVAESVVVSNNPEPAYMAAAKEVERRMKEQKKPEPEPEPKPALEEKPEIIPEEKPDADDKNSGDEKFSDDVIERAALFGLDETDIAAFKDGPSLNRFLNKLEKEQGGATENSAPKKDDDDFEIDEEKFEPEVVKMSKTVKGLKAQLEKVQNQLKESDERRHQTDMQQQERAFDDMFDVIGDEFDGVFGKGTVHSLKKDSAELQARNLAVRRFNALLDAAVRDGEELPPPVELMRKAALSEFSKHAIKVKNKKLAEKLKERESQIITRPSSKEGTEKTGKTNEDIMKEVHKILGVEGQPVVLPRNL